MLDVLARFGATATFFVVGRNALAHPGLVARTVAEGHVVSNHTHDHRWLDRLDPAGVADEVDRGRPTSPPWVSLRRGSSARPAA